MWQPIAELRKQMKEPLILTLQLDARAQSFYEELRHRFFPPERNVIPAHLTLFHHLPDTDATEEAVSGLAGRTPTFQLKDPVARSIGRGVAIFLQSGPLTLLHRTLSAEFEHELIPQDRQPFRPHIVVQNKASSETARRTLEQLRAVPFVEPVATGLTLWRYVGGPWEHVGDFVFEASQAWSAAEETGRRRMRSQG